MENTFNFPDILEENSLQIPEQNYSSEETNESTNIKGIKNMLNINDTTDTKLNALKMISCPINININEKRRVESYD